MKLRFPVGHLCSSATAQCSTQKALLPFNSSGHIPGNDNPLKLGTVFVTGNMRCGNAMPYDVDCLQWPSFFLPVGLSACMYMLPSA